MGKLQNERQKSLFLPFFLFFSAITFEKLLTIGSGNKLLHKQQMKFCYSVTKQDLQMQR